MYAKRIKLRPKLAPFLAYVDKASHLRAKSNSLSSVDLDASWIDLETIKSWLQTCDHYHEGHCLRLSTLEDLQLSRPLWLIDVKRRCLVRADAAMRYFALSYVWGPSTSACTIQATLHEFLQEGAFAIKDALLPSTIIDAIALVEILEQSYLWIDRLCIVQDDGLEKITQLNSMADIYAGAYATIVVADGNASTGICGINRPRNKQEMELPPRIFDKYLYNPFLPDYDGYGTIFRGALHSTDDLSQKKPVPHTRKRDENVELGASITKRTCFRHIEYFQNKGPHTSSSTLALVVEGRAKADADILERQSSLLLDSDWNSRAWTFQEHLFSRRKIIFQNNTVNWDCHCEAWHEAQNIASKQILHRRCGKHVNTDAAFDIYPWPDFYRFARMVSLYNERSLTHANDAPLAFAGALSTFSRSFVGGFVSGLPRMLFDCALLWQPYSEIKRRTPVPVDSQNLCLPSWSWLGWEGTLDSQSWRGGYAFIRKNPDEFLEEDNTFWQPTSLRVESTVKWLFMQGDEKFEVFQDAYKYRDSCLQQDFILPTGWSRHECEKSKKPFFTHVSSAQDFWCPIPLPDETLTITPPIYPSHLWTQTRRAYFTVGKAYHNTKTTECACCDLVDSKGVWVGTLRSHYSMQMDLPQGPKVELIELSRGSVEDQITESINFDEWEKWPRTNGRYEFYNVMLIRREEGFAYRVAVGRVIKEAWEMVDKTEVELTLL